MITCNVPCPACGENIALTLRMSPGVRDGDHVNATLTPEGRPVEEHVASRHPELLMAGGSS